MSDAPPSVNPNADAVSPKVATSVLAKTSQLAQQRTTPLLGAMFSALDDLFFDLASRAKSNQDQNLYFESLREVRLKKNEIIEIFGKELKGWFLALAPNQRSKQRSRDAEHGSDVASLALVDDTQMEKDVVVTDMVSRSRIEWKAELYQLTERFDRLTKKKVDADTNPLDPAQIADAFVVASRALDVDLKIMVLVFKQFDRSVLQALDEVLYRSNQLMIENGVLPNLTALSRRNVKRNPMPAKPKAPATPEAPAAEGDAGPYEGGAAAAPASGPAAGGAPAPAGSGRPGPAPASGPGGPEAPPGFGDAPPPPGGYVGEAEYQELSSLLGRMRSSGLKLPMYPELPMDGTGPVIPQQELVSVLSEIQFDHSKGEAAEEPLDIRKAISTISENRGSFQLQQVDEDVINVVAMFFDIILDDRNLPIEIQALVSRLQIPILKVALRDRTFFSDRKHPARQLLNEIARTSIGWDTSTKDQQDALFIRLTELVEEVLRNYDEHTEVFDKCLNDLMGFIERQEKRAQKVERRNTEQAAAKARSAKSRELVKVLMQERLADKILPSSITKFLIEEWQQVLFLRHLKHGPESPEWLDAVQTLDDLIWSVQKHEDSKSQDRLQRLLPDLQKRIAAGLESVEATPEQADAVLEQVKAVQAKLVKHDYDAVDAKPLSEEEKKEIDPKQAPAQRSWKEMTAVERQQVKYQSLMFEQLKRVDEMEIGTWVKYEDLKEGITRRCKLAAKILATETFVFVNRLGARVYEKPRKAFAYDLQMGYAQVLEQTALFDRTIHTIASNLRKLAEA